MDQSLDMCIPLAVITIRSWESTGEKGPELYQPETQEH